MYVWSRMLRVAVSALFCFALWAFPTVSGAEEPTDKLYVAVENAPVFSEASSGAKVIGHLGLGDSVEVKGSAPGGTWVPYLEAWRGRVDGWLLRKHLVADADFSSVVSCWPFRHVEIAVGDAFQFADLGADGSGIAGDNGGVGPAQAYIAGRVVKIVYAVRVTSQVESQPQRKVMIMTYDNRIPSVTPPREMGDEIEAELRPKGELAGCLDINNRSEERGR